MKTKIKGKNMKKEKNKQKKFAIVILLIIALMLLLPFVKGQTVLTQDFEGGTFPPTGWVVRQGGSGNLWSTVSSGTAHGGTGAAEYKYNSSNPANTWLISSGVSLTSGVVYTITYWERVSGSSFPENLKVTVGTANTIAGQTTTLQTLSSLINSTYVKQTVTFTPTITTTYYFGWNCYSATNMFYLDIDDILVAHVVCTTPGTPITLLGSGTGITTASLSWATGTPVGSSDVTYYWSLYNASNTLITSGNTTGTTASLTGLTCGTSYYFKVYAQTSCDGTSSAIATSANFSTTNCMANDECTGAIPITVGATCSYSTYNTTGVTASGTTPLPSCAGSVFNDVWFSFVVPSTGHVIINTQTGDITDAGMTIYSGACNSLVLIECDDDDSENGMMPMIDKFGLTPGTTIYIRFWEYGGNLDGTFGICVKEAAQIFPPSNDNCAGAIVVPIGNCVAGTIEGASNSSIAVSPCSGNADDDVWFSFVAADTAQLVTLSPTGSTDFYTQFFSGTCAALTSAGCYDENSLTIRWSGLTIGQTYYIRVYSYYLDPITGTDAEFALCVTTPVPPPSCVTNLPANDVCASATLISNLNGYCGNTSAAYTVDQPGNLVGLFCGSIDNNSWLSFVANNDTATLNIFVSNCSDGDGIQMQIYHTSDCLTFSEYSNCWNPGVMIDGTITATGLTIGQTYYLMIDGWAGDVCDFVISAKSGINTLPVSLVSFTGTCKNGQNDISWSTVTETNNNYFTVEKSTDGINWYFLQQVGGAGNSNRLLHYAITDKISENVVYYRLTQTDFDGKFEIFSPIAVNCGNHPSIKIYPNPVTEVLTIETDDTIRFEIVSIDGISLLSGTEKNIQLNSFAVGFYFLKIVSSSGDISLHKIVKQ